jgi:hypothetical protein
LRPLERGGVDVGGDHAEGLRQVRLGERHRDGVGLFAGGAGRAPDGEAGAVALLAQVLDQDREVVRLAEEAREVGGERVGELLALGRVLGLDRVEVGVEARVPGLAQPPREAVGDHGALGRAHRDAGDLVDQAARAIELAVAQLDSYGAKAGTMAGSLGEDAVEELEQALGIERLHDPAVRPGLAPGVAQLLRALGGEHHDRRERVLGQRAQRPDERPARPSPAGCGR